MNEVEIRAAKRARDTARKAAWRAKNRERSRETEKIIKRRTRARLRAQSAPAKRGGSAGTQALRSEPSFVVRSVIFVALAL
jgi:hypothetical protein